MLFADMTTGIGVTDRSRGHGRGRGRIPTDTPRTSQLSPSTMTTPVMLLAMGAQDQPFIMVHNLNYVVPSVALPHNQEVMFGCFTRVDSSTTSIRSIAYYFNDDTSSGRHHGAGILSRNSARCPSTTSHRTDDDLA
ncbi:uncharacterized protein DS421_7g217960 [Arachis hypogaea]|nr:uncharacterized protein DS421_7g217960 [Arachis hypogaea]